MKVRYTNYSFVAWHLIPTIRFGIGIKSWFIAITFLKMDLSLIVDKNDK